MNNDSSRSNVLELIADHMNNSTPMHLRSESDTEPSSASSTELQSAEESYPTSKKPAANTAPKMSSSYPSQQAKGESTTSYPSQQAKGEIDVDTVPRSRSVSPAPRSGTRSTTVNNGGPSPTVADPRRQRRRRRQDRLQDQRQGGGQQQQQSGAQVRRVNTLPSRTRPVRPVAPLPPATADAVETKKLARSKTGPIDHMRLTNSVDVEMDDSELDILKVVAERASESSDVRLRVNDEDESESSSSGGTSSSSSSGGISHYDEEVGRYMPGGEEDEKGGARASMTAVQYIMNDLSGNSIGLRDLKAGTTNAVVTLGATPAMATSVAGAYSAAPGVGYIRNEQFQAGVLGSTCATTATALLSDVSIQYSCGGHARRSMADESGKSVESAVTHASQQQRQPVISAVRVDEDDLELHIREQITSTAAQAEVVDFEKETEDHVKNEIEKVQRKYFGGAAVAFLLLIVAIVIAVVVSVTQNKGNADSPKHHPVVVSTLASISEKGHLNCGLSKRDEDAKFHPEYEQLWKGFNGDWCRAIAAAALDGDVSVTIHDVSEAERWEALADGTLDVLVVGTPASTESLHFDLDKEVPAIFSTPFLFDGVGVGGMPDVIKHCATTKGFENYLGCRSVRVCACQGSSALEVFQKILHPSQIVETSSLEELYGKFASGCCNMLATDWSNERAEVTVRNQSGYTGEYALGEALYSKQPYALATRKIQNDHPINATDHAAGESDPQVWSEFVDWVLQALIAAEQNNITQATSDLITETEVFGDKYRNAFKHAVNAVGNYGEVYERNMGHVVPRDGMNLIANGSTGLHYHRSIGDVTDFGVLNNDGTLAAIKERGKLVCGVPILQNKNFTLGAGEVATQPPARFMMDDLALEEHDLGGAGVDTEFCRALASSIFQGLSVTNADTDSCSAFNDTESVDSNARVEFIFLESTADGYTQLNSGEIDVISGYRMTLQGDVREPTTGQGYTYSQPFLYGPVSEQEHVTANNRCMVTRQHDRQWSDFVQVVVMSLFYAEEHGIDQPRANSMPYVNLFGPSFKRMMKDSVFAVGNYGEVYERLVQPYLQRQGGPNTLNAEADPQLCSFPGPII